MGGGRPQLGNDLLGGDPGAETVPVTSAETVPVTSRPPPRPLALYVPTSESWTEIPRQRRCFSKLSLSAEVYRGDDP